MFSCFNSLTSQFCDCIFVRIDELIQKTKACRDEDEETSMVAIHKMAQNSVELLQLAAPYCEVKTVTLKPS